MKYILISVLFLISCQKENVGFHDERKIVINGLIDSDNSLAVNVSGSLSITDTAKMVFENGLFNSKVYMYESNNYVDTLCNLAYKQYIDYITNVRQVEYSEFIQFLYIRDLQNFRAENIQPKPGKEYKVVVKTPGYPDAFATTQIPDMVKIDHWDTTHFFVQGADELKHKIAYNVEFLDPKENKNYYVFYIYFSSDFETPYLWADGVTHSCPYTEEEINHGTMNLGIAFSDKSINGNKCRISGNIDVGSIGFPFYDDHSHYKHFRSVVYFKLYSVTEGYFKYIQTLNLHLKNLASPIAEPVQVYSNVQGGYGVFEGAAVSTDSLVFK